ncbi:IPTL-CTERM sorting domain-containing protein [Sulfidibacter corallicola]|uniref:IPTL-CTERM sorting domain-containing protein n=1 Tax=Sulfidibacter corallicola TaxID=2818388 RepID=A0A8A4U286_SULCO|nr:IPTL-CTERM sorting domain-containing protein [Sulfidibacter corallicola]QTD52845.1 IPTL-CTERM sorting domain-containing protein [Sulfidibacter corallicola]
MNIHVVGNSGGLPDTTNLSGASIFSLENVTPDDLNVGDFVVNIPGGLILTPGTYWLVVQANQNPDEAGQWLWRSANSTDDLFPSAWFENFELLGDAACTNTWGDRVTSCAVTATPPENNDQAFRLEGDELLAGVTVAPTTLETTEDGSTTTFDVVLDAPPTANVDIGISSSDVTEGTVAPASLTFTSANWNIPQTVTVTPGASGDGNDGNVMYTVVTADGASTDTDYDGFVVDDVTVTNLNIDGIAGVFVDPNSGLVTTEAGGTDTFVIFASGTPTMDVTIPLSISNGEATVQVSVTLTGPGYSENVTVTGADDDIDDGDAPFTVVTGTTTSGDPSYNGVTVADITGTNTDDDTAGITVTPVAVEPLVTDENLTTSSFDVVLDTEPTADVVLNFESNDTTEGTVGPASATFTSGNWNTPQTITITGVDDFLDDGNVNYTIITRPASSTDTNYDGLDPADVTAVNNDNGDSAGVTVTPNATPLIVTEDGGTTDTFTVVLDAMPANDVTIAVSTQNANEGTADTASLTFTNANWNVAQTVTVTGVDDAIDDGNQLFSILLADTVSTDPVWNGVPVVDVLCQNNDDDTFGFNVNPTAGLVTTEAGGSDTFTVNLLSEPTADVTIPVVSSNVNEGTPDLASLTFTPLNFSTPQTVTVTGVQDGGAPDGDIAYTIDLGPATSTDTVYNGQTLPSVGVTNNDDDLPPGVTVNPTSGLTVTEAGGTDTFTVVLDSQPTADVTIPVVSDDTTEGTPDSATLTFTNANWNVAQTVTVTGVDDDFDDGDIAFNIDLGPTTSTDAAFNNLTVPSVGVTNSDNDTASVTVTPTSGLVTDEDGATATFEVRLGATPTSAVTIPITSDDTTEGTVDQATLTFTLGNTPQTVTVTGVDDPVVDGDIGYNIIVGDPSSSDPAYDALGDGDTADVSATNLDNDICGPVTIDVTIGGDVIVTGTPGCIFDLYNTTGSTNTGNWILLASGITIPASGTIVVPGVTGAEDHFYVATVTGTFDILNASGGPVITVPTLGEWGMIAFVSILMLAAMAFMRRKRTA